MVPTDVELATALMALRAIAFQAEKQLSFLMTFTPSEDPLDKGDLVYVQNCLDALNPSISWLEEQIATSSGSRANLHE